MMQPVQLVTGTLMALLASGALTSCKQEKPTVVAKAGREAVQAVTVEVRPDGLAYLPGATIPFTGEAITAYPDAPWLVKLKEPYTAGKRDGDKLELFKNGTPKTLRRYDKGMPKYAASFHKNGQKKFELQLNAQDKGEGPYQRWYEDGTVESTSGLDAEERWHGVMKEWTRTGELKTHHVLEHGLLREIIFETPESRQAREAIGLILEKAAAIAAPLPKDPVSAAQ